MSSLFEGKSDESSYPREECGVFAIYGHEDSARITFFGLFALQHRGQESAGIVSSDGCNVSEHKGMGLASEVFKEATLQKLPGKLAIGHVRYSSAGWFWFIIEQMGKDSETKKRGEKATYYSKYGYRGKGLYHWDGGDKHHDKT